MNGRAFSAGLLLLAALLAATWLGLQPPSPLPSSAPPGAFSAERALPRLRRVLDAAGEGTPHPAGSGAGQRVRDAVVAEFRSLGVEPRVVDSLTCNRYLTCTPVSNVVARVPGRARGAAVLVSAHHDSVPAGPGAADDGSGVAIVLELARALRAEPAGSDVILLVDDAEEAGLGGAEAFLKDPAAREVGAIVNLEARGTGGPSLLFETTGGGAAIARRFAEGARRPMGSSLLSTVYRMLPNDTNLTVLRRLGVPGANLAFVDGAVRYHTPRDDLAHLDPRSVQHQGENALALVHAFSGPIRPEGAAVWFDLLGLVVVRFPEGLALPAALAALFLALGGAVAGARHGVTGAGRIALGALALPLGLGVAAVAGYAAGRSLGLDPIFRPWVANPGPLVASFLLAGIAGALVPALLLGRRAGAAGLRDGARVLLAVLAVALAATLPGASYLLVVPALTWGVAGILTRRAGDRGEAVADLVTLLAAGLVLLPPAWLLYPALGHAAGPAVATAVALVMLPLLPLAATTTLRTRAVAVALPAVLGAATLGVALLLPGADVDSPERVIVYFHQDADAGLAHVLANADSGRLPDAVRAAGPFSPTARVHFGWGTLRPSFEAAADPLPAPGPEVEVLEDRRDGDEIHWRARLRSPRGAGELQLAVPPAASTFALTLDGTFVPLPVPKLARWYGGWWLYRFPARPEGIEVAIAAEASGPVELVVADQSPGLPPAAAVVAAARPPWAVTQQEGDLTLFTRRIRIGADAPAAR
jgi:hypothetical protein